MMISARSCVCNYIDLTSIDGGENDRKKSAYDEFTAIPCGELFPRILRRTQLIREAQEMLTFRSLDCWLVYTPLPNQYFIIGAQIR